MRWWWRLRRRRAVRVHFEGPHGQDLTVEGVLLRRWPFEFVLLDARMLGGEQGAQTLPGLSRIPRGRVFLYQGDLERGDADAVILATANGDRELRLFEASQLIPRPSEGTLYSSSAGDHARELGVAAVACAVRLVSETIAGFVVRTYTGDGPMNRRPVLDSPQARLFQEPAEGWSSFDVWCDLHVSLELEKHGFLWKTATRRGVEEIYPVDPRCFQVVRQRGVKRVYAWIEGRKKDVTETVIHFRAWSAVPGAVDGTSTPELHRRALRSTVALEEYRGAYFENDGMPGLVLEMPGTPSKQQRAELLESWMQRHSKAANKHKPGLVWGGVKVEQLAPNLREAQAAELTASVVRDVARMFRIYPSELLLDQETTGGGGGGGGGGGSKSPQAISELFHRFSLLHRERRVERTLHADRQLFPDRALYPRHDTSELLRADFATTARAVHELIQDGAITKNEGRAWLGLEPVPGGDVFQLTPVGGAPNPANDSAAEAD